MKDQNNFRLKYIPEDMRSKEVCLNAVINNHEDMQYVPAHINNMSFWKEVVKCNGLTLKHIKRSEQDYSLAWSAIENNPIALQYVYSKLKDFELCKKAVETKGTALKYVPEKQLNNQLYKSAVKSEGIALQYVPSFYRNKEICLDAVSQDGLALEFVPESIKDESILKIAVSSNIKALSFVNNKTKDLCNLAFELSHEAFRYIPDEFKSKEMCKTIISSYPEMTKYIPKNIKNELMPANNDFIESCESMCLSSLEFPFGENGDSRVAIYYISDLHLDHKINIENNMDYNDIYEAVKKVVTKLVYSINESSKLYDGFPLLLIAGDVSSNMNITKTFYQLLSEWWNPKRIIAILGNHEMWGFGIESLETIINSYSDFFDSCGIRFLHNDLLIVEGSIWCDNSIKIVTEKELLNFYNCVNPTDQKNLFRNSSYVILGGTAFAGLSNEFNANNGIYRTAITSREQERLETEKFCKIYDILLDVIPDKKVVVLTHMPMNNWSNKHYNPNWIYVNGHTHHNSFINDENAVVFSDNQLGYDSTKFEFKWFSLSTHYDFFSNYNGGIYEITKDDYYQFCRGKGLAGRIRRSGQIYMVKRSNLYCFFFKWEKTNRFYLLDGGNLNNIDHQDLTYYYNNLKKYGKILKIASASRQKALNSISNAVKLIGGDGRIHGSIVDIDFYNHIYLNLFDGTITPYYAISVVDRLDYPSVSALLEERRPDLHQRLLSHKAIKAIVGNVSETSVLERVPTENSDTSMYGYSLIMKRIQALLNENVVRIWNEDLLREIVEEPSGQLENPKKQLVEEIDLSEL